MYKNYKFKKSSVKPALFLALLLSLSYGNIFAVNDTNELVSEARVSQQDFTITGTITSQDDGMPVAGANVVLKGGKGVGTVTDFDGNYSLDVPSASSVLLISYIGFVSQEISVSGRTKIDISLVTDVSTLDEVVVVGYGTQKKESLTGAIDQVKSEAFEDRAVNNVGISMQGQAPGLVVSRTSSRPGNEDVTMQIRGITSVNGGSPLIVIDGAPIVNDSEFYQMNPDDIESVSVLKDGSASIYGARAANGVVLVVTKKGKGKMQVSFDTMLRVNFIGIDPPVSSYEEYGQLWLDAAEQDTTPYYWNWGEDTVRSIAAGESGYFQTVPAVWGYDGLVYMAPADRYEELYGTSYGNQTNLSVSGSSEQFKYRLSLGHQESQGALKTAYDGVEQYSVRLNTDFNITDKVNLSSSISLQKNEVSSPSSSFGQSLVTQDPPVFPAQNDLGQWYAPFGLGGTNSIAGTQEGGRDDFEENMAKLTLNLDWDIGYGFSANGSATFNHIDTRTDISSLYVGLYNWEGGEPTNGINQNPNMVTEQAIKEYQTYQGFVNYEKILGKNSFKGMAGIVAEKYTLESLWGRRYGLENEGVYDLNVATGVQENEGGQTQTGLYSYIARINYNYAEKYLVEFIGRRDGSSSFAEGYKFKNYGSVSIGWNMQKEKFLENFTALTVLKPKLSVGSSGNQVGIGPYDYVSTIGIGTELFGQGGTLSPTSYVNGLTTTSRTWEDVVMKNIGLEFGFFNNKLSGTFDIYQKDNNGMLVNVEYPEVLGATAPKTNSGDLEVKGWEAALNWRESRGDFTYNIGVNMSDSTNELVNLEGGSAIQAGLRSTVQGYPLNSYFVWETDGLFQTQAEVDAYNALYTKGGSEVPTGANAIRIGDTKKVDLDGNGVINDQNADEYQGQGDVKYIGDASPHYVFGINLGARYKGFDFTAFFYGALEQTVIRGGVNAYPFSVPWSNQITAYNGKTWTPENTGATYPRLTAQRNLAGWNWANTDVFTQNNRYIRLKTLVVGYTIPKEVLDKLKMDKIRFYLSGNDLFEFSTLVDDFDPEAGSTAVTDDRSVYPFQRTLALGVNITF